MNFQIAMNPPLLLLLGHLLDNESNQQGVALLLNELFSSLLIVDCLKWYLGKFSQQVNSLYTGLSFSCV